MPSDRVDIPAIIFGIIGVLFGGATLVFLWLDRKVFHRFYLESLI
jgi:hypothetical protein